MDDTRAAHTGDLASLKGRFPFRLGTTSYIVPDDILPNVALLADTLDDIELVLFESDEISNMPDEAVLERLEAVASGHDLTYTVHLPLDADLTSPHEDVRAESVRKCCRTIDLTRRLDPFAWILHVNGERSTSAPASDVQRWRGRALSSIDGILAGGIRPDRVCVETLGYPFAFLRDIVHQMGLSVCLDVGHVLLSGQDVDECMDLYLDRTRVVHLHGVLDGRDHRGLDVMAPGFLLELCRAFAPRDGAQRVVTIEVFGREELARSLRALEEVLLCQQSRS
jgi:sugar phosphate isomerase/epimerase